MVPTVERGLLEAAFCSIELVGESPRIVSYRGFSICPRNCRAYEESDSTYRRCPSAYKVSKASELLPDPETPVKTTSFFFGISRFTDLRLCSRAPLTTMKSGSLMEALL